MGRKVMVYSYWTWTPGEGLGQIPPAKRSQPQIEALRGLAILFSGEQVDEDDLGCDGSYLPQQPATTLGGSATPA